jgi:cytochrome d ubiquinol oxidase subunit II
MSNYSTYPWMIAAPVLGFVGLLLAALGFQTNRRLPTLLAASLAIFGIVSTAGLSLFPFLLPSSTMVESSLTLWDASSSHLTLFIMLVVSCFFLPIILLYTAWVFRVMRGPVTSANLEQNPHAY